jgi:RNA polymerase sigma-70 factor (ECF subfamily)
MDPESSLELVQRAAAGDNEALEQLLQRYIPSLTRWARGRLPGWARDLAETQDLVQETLVHTLKHLPRLKFEREGAFHAYCRQAVMNRIYDEQRRVQRRPIQAELAENIAASDASPLEETIGREALTRYETSLAELRDVDREAIIARIELGQGYDEIAVALGKPTPDAARVAVQRALVRLADKMKHVG